MFLRRWTGNRMAGPFCVYRPLGSRFCSLTVVSRWRKLAWRMSSHLYVQWDWGVPSSFFLSWGYVGSVCEMGSRGKVCSQCGWLWLGGTEVVLATLRSVWRHSISNLLNPETMFFFPSTMLCLNLLSYYLFSHSSLIPFLFIHPISSFPCLLPSLCPSSLSFHAVSLALSPLFSLTLSLVLSFLSFFFLLFLSTYVIWHVNPDYNFVIYSWHYLRRGLPSWWKNHGTVGTVGQPSGPEQDSAKTHCSFLSSGSGGP